MTFQTSPPRIHLLTITILLLVPATFICPQGNNPAYIEKTQKAEALSDEGQFTAARILYEEALENAVSDNDTRQQACFNDRIGRCLSMEGRDIEALKYFTASVNLASVINDSTLLGIALNHMGISYEYSGHIDSAFNYFQEALRIREALDDHAGMAESYRNIAQVLRVLRRLPEARRYCRMALEMSDETTPFKTIANIYNETAYLYELDNILDSARLFYNKLISISSENDYYQGISVGYSNLASVFERQGDCGEALRLKQIGLTIDKKFNDRYGILNSYRGIADCYAIMGNFETSLIYLDSASEICDSTWLSERNGIEQSRYFAYRGLGNYRKALAHFEESVILKDSLFNETKRKNIAEILTRYETEKKEQQIELLNNANEIRASKIRSQRIIIIAILSLSIALAVISFQIIKRKNERIERMVLELKNYMLTVRNDRPEPGNNRISGNMRIQSLMDQFSFTRREAEIMCLILEGMTNEEIAERLFVSTNTIKFHIKNIYIKLDVKNRIQALRRTSYE